MTKSGRDWAPRTLDSCFLRIEVRKSVSVKRACVRYCTVLNSGTLRGELLSPPHSLYLPPALPVIS